MISTVFTWILIGIYLLLVASTVLVVLLENRQPERTIAWVVALVLLPVVGLVVFYFFGQNNRHIIHRIRRKRGRKKSKLLSFNPSIERRELAQKGHAVATNSLKEGEEGNFDFVGNFYAPLQRLCADEFGAPVQPLERVLLLDNGVDFLAELIRAFAKAERYIFMQTYIIEDDAVGRLVSDVLADAAERGVEVRLLYDDVGCWRVPKGFFRSMERRGVRTAAFMPVRFPSLTHKINYRNHRKVCVVDGVVGFVGGMNLALRYMGRADFIWRDLHLSMSGVAVDRLESIFLGDWAAVTEGVVERRAKKHNIRKSAQDAPAVQIVTSDPQTAVPQLMYAYTWAAMHARQYLYVQTPYFMPTEPFLQALKTAAMGGTDVRVMMPRKPDGIMLRRINDSYVAELLAAGIRVYLYEGGFLHSKCISADDNWCAVGSANMDFRSFLNNIEVGALVYDRNTCVVVRNRFERDMELCSEIDAVRWSRRSLLRRLLESATRILSPLF